MSKYDPCEYCQNADVKQSVDGMTESCLGKCLYADLEEKDMKRELKISRIIDDIERFENANRECGYEKTAGIFKAISNAMKIIFERK